MKVTIKMRGKIVLKALEGHIKKGDIILDIGAGDGTISDMIKKRFGCKLIKIDRGDEIPIQYFDAALFISSMHHMELRTQVGYIERLLKQTKKIIIFEAEPSLWLFMIDRLMALIHGDDCPLRHQTMEEWGFIAELRGAGSWEADYVNVPWYYPHNHTRIIITPVGGNKEG